MEPRSDDKPQGAHAPCQEAARPAVDPMTDALLAMARVLRFAAAEAAISERIAHSKAA
jgi:hypothetical protein